MAKLDYELGEGDLSSSDLADFVKHNSEEDPLFQLLSSVFRV